MRGVYRQANSATGAFWGGHDSHVYTRVKELALTRNNGAGTPEDKDNLGH